MFPLNKVEVKNNAIVHTGMKKSLLKNKNRFHHEYFSEKYDK